MLGAAVEIREEWPDRITDLLRVDTTRDKWSSAVAVASGWLLSLKRQRCFEPLIRALDESILSPFDPLLTLAPRSRP